MQKVYQKEQSVKPYFEMNTYESLKDFLGKVEERNGELHIFSTNILAKNVNNQFQLPTSTIEELYEKLFPEFRTVPSQIHLQSVCRKFILDQKFNNETYLLNRLGSIVETFYLFADLGLDEITFSFQDTRKDEIKWIINHLLKDPLTIGYTTQKRNYQKREIAVRLGAPQLNKFIFYEIDSMNFGRMNFIHWLKTKGLSVEFRVPFHPGYKNAHKYWENVYQIITRQKLSELYAKPVDPMIRGQKFANFYENLHPKDGDRRDVSIIEFETPHDFSLYSKHHHDRFIAIEPEKVRMIIEQTKSDVYENDIGKFIYHIQFCKVEKGKLFIDFETLIELLTSGWVHTKNVAGPRALSLLIDLQEYMSGTETMEEIKGRLHRLLELEWVSVSFDRENGDDAGRNRMKRYMLNPFRTFSFLNQERYQVSVNQLLELVEQTEKLCRYLILEEDQTLKVNEYFGRWKNVLEKAVQDSKKKTFWASVFTTGYPEDWEFTIHELLQLLYLRVSSKEKGRKKIKSLPSIQEVMMDTDHSRTLHITNMTQLNFPESRHSTISEFFSYTELKEVIQTLPEGKSRFLHSLWVDFTVADRFEELGSYQLYGILRNYDGPIVFSWIKHLEKDGVRNIYLDILADLYCNGEIVTYKGKEDSHFGQNGPFGTSGGVDVNVIRGKIPDLFWLDHDFCSKKFFLTSIIEQQQTYESDFHHELLFSKIGRLFSFSKDGKAEFRELIFPLFPQWTDTKKENLIDTEFSTEFRMYKTYENISYPREMKGLHILRSIYRENRRTKARNQYRKERGFVDKELLKQFAENTGVFHVKGEPGNHCKMCPHLGSCTEGMYAIDHISQ